jgi:predicted MPP superfamily phosphohydrolase
MDIYDALKERVGNPCLAQRMRLQVDHAADFYGGAGFCRFHPENLELIPALLKILLKITGLSRRAKRNALDIRVEEQEVTFENLPGSFHGFTILQLSDVHTDGFTDDGESLLKTLNGLKYDLCVMTGDFRFQTYGEHERCVALLRRVVESISCSEGIVGILGNHDFVEMSPFLEAEGLVLLINEAVHIHRDNQSFLLAGTDDPHFYGTNDLERSLKGASHDEFTLLMTHSPELYKEAAKAKVDYYLCGHTHGGQICLPWGVPIITNAGCPRKYVSGAWTFGGMRGYTSRGTGSSGLPVRFFCPPEVTLHRLLSGRVSK